MMRPCMPVTVLLIALVNPVDATEPAPTAKEVRNGVVKALPLIQKGSAGHVAHRTCFACHHQAIPILAMTTARSRGVSLKTALCAIVLYSGIPVFAGFSTFFRIPEAAEDPESGHCRSPDRVFPRFSTLKYKKIAQSAACPKMTRFGTIAESQLSASPLTRPLRYRREAECQRSLYNRVGELGHPTRRRFARSPSGSIW